MKDQEPTDAEVDAFMSALAAKPRTAHMSDWISFADRLPARDDADEHGEIWLLEANGNKRRGLWDWIPTRNFRGPIDAFQHWRANGFTHWMPLPEPPA